jgi:hypothetical protein
MGSWYLFPSSGRDYEITRLGGKYYAKATSKRKTQKSTVKRNRKGKTVGFCTPVAKARVGAPQRTSAHENHSSRTWLIFAVRSLGLASSSTETERQKKVHSEILATGSILHALNEKPRGNT